jgi:hypothetical protein
MRAGGARERTGDVERAAGTGNADSERRWPADERQCDMPDPGGERRGQHADHDGEGA